MNAMLTPPPVGPASPAPAPQGSSPQPAGPTGPGSRGSAGRVISVVAIVVGSLVLVGAVVPTIRGAIAEATRTTEVLTADVTGVTGLELDGAAAHVTLDFSDVDEARLSLEGVRGDWRMERDGDELVVRSGDGFFGGGWGDWGVFGRSEADERVVLTLPSSLRGMDADLSLGAGELIADGEFGALDIDLGAGSVDVTGSADHLSVDMSAGSAELDLAGVRDAELSLAAGSLTGQLTGRAPDRVDLDVSAGELDLTLPDEAYAVTQDVTAGQFDNGLTVDPGSDHVITVEVSAGRVSLRPAP